MIYGSVCSGIEASSVAWHPLGWRAAFLSEIKPFPRAVLSCRFPDVPLHGDFTTIEADRYEPIDLLVGGTPCQSFSIAGLRGGLDDDRGNLALEYLRLADRLRPRWLVWENVPGVLSSNDGRDFGAILGGMVELGYGVAYRVLDARHFGVPQRRRRVFVVGYLGDWRRAAAVLFERHSLQGNSPPRRDARAETTGTLGGVSPGGGWKIGADEAVAGCGDVWPTLSSAPGSGYCTGQEQSTGSFSSVAFGGNNTSGAIDVATTLNAKGGSGRMDFETETLITHTLRGEGWDASEDGTGRVTPIIPVAFDCKASAGFMPAPSETAPTLRSMSAAGGRNNGGGQIATTTASGVRRLTPRECERLQGFQDDWTKIAWWEWSEPRQVKSGHGRVSTRQIRRWKEASDGPRYEAVGNSMAAPVMAWIGRRIAMVDALP